MTLLVDGKEYYRTSEACDLVGISRMTYLRWVRDGTINDVSYRDWRGWRLFTEDDLARMKAKTNLIRRVG